MAGKWRRWAARTILVQEDRCVRFVIPDRTLRPEQLKVLTATA